MKASEVVLDGHWEVVLAVLFSHFHTEFAQPSCWSLSLRRILVGTLSVKLLVLHFLVSFSVTFGTNPRLNYADISFCGKLPTTHFLGIFRTLLHETPRA